MPYKSFVKNLSLLVITVLFLSHCGQITTNTNNNLLSENRGILNGQLANPEKRKQLNSILLLSMKMDKGQSLCSASYIGKGMVLTAYHCIGLNLTNTEKKPSLKIRPASKTTPAKELIEADYEAFFPEAEGYKEASAGKDKDGKEIKIKVPNPDLAILKINNAEALELDKLEPITLTDETLEMGDKNLLIAGFGLAPVTKDSAPTIIGRLFFGTVEIASLDLMNYKMLYQNKMERAAAQPGDSGGPLFKLNGDKLTQYGVASFIRTLRIDSLTKAPTMLLSNYVRLDREPVQKWIKATLNR